MRLLVIRHGKAVEDAPSGLDRDRVLAPRGERQGDWLGERLDRSDEVRPALIVSSPFARALQTAQRVAKVVGIADDDIVRDDRLGLERGSVGAIVDLVGALVEGEAAFGAVEDAQKDAAGAVLLPIAAIVGHQPLLESVIGVLTAGPTGRGPRVRTGECWVLDGPDERGLWGLGPSMRAGD